MSKARWGEYPNFSKEEFNCKFTGENNMQHEFMVILQAIREEFNKPMTVTSGFRSLKHPIESKKPLSNGEHTTGNCSDVSCKNGSDRFKLVQLALKHGITRIGIAKNFLHLGIGGKGLPCYVIWDYQ